MKLLVSLLLAAVAAPAVAATPSDLRDYALSECLIRQTASPALRDEAYRLAEIVLHRAGVTPFAWSALREAVDAEFAARPMMTTHVDAPVAQSDRPVPLAYCLAVVDSPRVRAATARTLRQPQPR